MQFFSYNFFIQIHLEVITYPTIESGNYYMTEGLTRGYFTSFFLNTLRYLSSDFRHIVAAIESSTLSHKTWRNAQILEIFMNGVFIDSAHQPSGSPLSLCNAFKNRFCCFFFFNF